MNRKKILLIFIFNPVLLVKTTLKYISQIIKNIEQTHPYRRRSNLPHHNLHHFIRLNKSTNIPAPPRNNHFLLDHLYTLGRHLHLGVSK